MQTKFFIKKITFSKKLHGKRTQKKWLNFGGKRRKNTFKNRQKAKIINSIYTKFTKLKNTTIELQNIRRSEYGIQNLNSADETKFKSDLNFQNYIQETIGDFSNENMLSNKNLNIFSNTISKELDFFKSTKSIYKDKFFKSNLKINYDNKKYQLDRKSVRSLFELYKSDLFLKRERIASNLNIVENWDPENNDIPDLPFGTPTGQGIDLDDEEGRNEYLKEKHEILKILNNRINAIKNDKINLVLDDFKHFIKKRGKYLLDKNLANLNVKILN